MEIYDTTQVYPGNVVPQQGSTVASRLPIIKRGLAHWTIDWGFPAARTRREINNVLRRLARYAEAQGYFLMVKAVEPGLIMGIDLIARRIRDGFDLPLHVTASDSRRRADVIWRRETVS